MLTLLALSFICFAIVIACWVVRLNNGLKQQAEQLRRLRRGAWSNRVAILRLRAKHEAPMFLRRQGE